MPRLTSRISPQIFRVASTVRSRVRGDTALAAPSPYVQWHGPTSSASNTPSLRCTPIADLVLLQGSAPAEAAVHLELEGRTDHVPILHRFPHPDSPTAQRRCFELTLDHRTVNGSAKVRLLVDGAPGAWILLPSLPKPGNMTGVEALDACPACGSTNSHEAGRRQHLTMITCDSCGLVMTSPRPAEDHTLVRYSERYFDEEYLPSQQLTPALTAHIDSILDHAEPAKTSTATLFELGVGGGNLLARARDRGWNVSGTDVNPASVAHATSRGLRVWCENADHAESLPGPYGAVISEMSLEHVRRPEHFVTLASHALAPNGRLVIYTVSAEGNSFEHSGMASPLVGPAEHLFLFSAGSLVALCESAGLRVDALWRNSTGDEIGIVATKRRDTNNPGTAAGRD